MASNGAVATRRGGSKADRAPQPVQLSSSGRIRAIEILLVNQPLPVFGGTETYLLTVANELQRLGHDVGIYAGAGGEQVEVARRRGFSTVEEERRLPARPQVVISQHAESAYAMALRYPESVRVYVAHSPIFQPQRPPLLSGTCHAIVALNERVKLQCESLAVDTEVVRLRQPVDTARFTDRGARGRLRRVLMLGNHFGDRLYRNHRIVAEACEDLGLELDHIGTGGRASTSPEIEIPAADAVVGIGRCVLETMACARAAYVFGNRGGDGWVTGERTRRWKRGASPALPRIRLSTPSG